jgi:nicotinamidase-related amidase
MPVWDAFLTERDKRVFGGSGYGRRAGWGQRPVLLVIDVNYNFVGDRPEPIEESIKRWRNSCGAEGWEAAERIRELTDVAHARGIPVLYSTGVRSRPDQFDRGRWRDKNSRAAEDVTPPRADGNTIIAPIAPQPQDIVIEKAKPSVFYGSMLTGYLVDLQADSIICCGTTTSGCVRATVLDGFSANFRMAVVEEATFDRGQASHAISLFDMHQKYADVVPLAETLAFMRSLPEGLFDERMPILKEYRARAGEPVGAR